MNYFLIGMMGCGKTSIGRALSKEIDYGFIDLDLEIEKFSKMTIKNIFEKHGEEKFRELEVKVSRKLITNSLNNIIATGGGFAIDGKNIEWMKENGKIIWLQATAKIIFERIKNDNKRPLLNLPSIQKIEEILKIRTKKYEIANYYIDTNNKSVNEIIKTIKKNILN